MPVVHCILEYRTVGPPHEFAIEFRILRHPNPFNPRIQVNWNDDDIERYGISQELIEMALANLLTNGQWQPLCDAEYDWEDGHDPSHVRPRGRDFIHEPEPEEELPSGYTLPVPLAPIERPSLRDATQLQIRPAQIEDAVPAGIAEFHNPYNFIASPPRLTAQQHPLGDREPESWDRYHQRFYSGWIDVEAVAATPLLVNDPNWVSDESRHKTTWRILRDEQGRPRLPETGLRGMLSVAYETATNSRWRVFNNREQRLTRRMRVEDGLGVVPFRVEQDENGLLGARLLLGTATALPRYTGARPPWEVQESCMLAAFVPAYAPAERVTITAADHGREVWAWLRCHKHTRRPFKHWTVVQIAESKADLAGDCPAYVPPNRKDLGDTPIKAKGWLCVTNQSVGIKKYERFFFHRFSDQVPLIPLQDASEELNSLGRSWGEVIQAYRDAHGREEIWERTDRRNDRVDPDKYINRDIGRTAWSGHIYQDGRRDARDKGHCENWAELRASEGGHRASVGYLVLTNTGEARGLIPVQVARVPFSNSPLDQLHPSLRPATQRDQLSPADRVFGWVAQSEGGAHRGQLRIASVRCLDTAEEAIKNHRTRVPLAILSTPKLKQSAFYLAADEQGTPLSSQELNSADYAGRRSPRGRKVFPHHGERPDGYWDVSANPQPEPAVGGYYREYVRAQGERDSQNRSVKEWVCRGTRFSFRLHVTNLSEAELGALLWLLTLDTDNRPWHFRFGGGKPLGFGSLRIRITETGLSSGEAWAEAWSDLCSSPAEESEDQKKLIARLIGRYQEDLVSSQPGYAGEFEQLPMIAGLLCCGRGPQDGAPVHAPRLQRVPQEPGRNYEWFSNSLQPLPTLPSGKRLKRDHKGG